MKLTKNLARYLMLLSLACLTTGCAAGAATSGYSLKAQSSDSLTASAEQKIVDRVKREMAIEGHPCITCP